MVKTCECCGHPVLDSTDFPELTPMQYRIFKLILASGQAGITRRQMMEIIYAEDPNGGPDNENILNVQRANMRDKLAARGLRIVSDGGHYARWRVEALNHV